MHSTSDRWRIAFASVAGIATALVIAAAPSLALAATTAASVTVTPQAQRVHEPHDGAESHDPAQGLGREL